MEVALEVYFVITQMLYRILTLFPSRLSYRDPVSSDWRVNSKWFCHQFLPMMVQKNIKNIFANFHWNILRQNILIILVTKESFPNPQIKWVYFCICP